jgi:hypothetical protein
MPISRQFGLEKLAIRWLRRLLPEESLEIVVSGGDSVAAERLTFGGTSIGQFEDESWDTVAGDEYAATNSLVAGDSIEAAVGGSDYELGIL